jgi:hypothetical protein
MVNERKGKASVTAETEASVGTHKTLISCANMSSICISVIPDFYAKTEYSSYA